MDALAALGIVLPITLIIQAFANLIGLGGSPRASIKLGENDKDEAVKITEAYHLDNGFKSFLIDPEGRIIATNPTSVTLTQVLRN